MRTNLQGLTLDAGVLRLFRAGIGLQLSVQIVLAAVVRNAPGALPRMELLYVPEAALMLAVLVWPGLPQRLGRSYLPVALALAVVLPFVFRQATLAGQVGSPERFIPIAGPEFLMALLVPTVITAWQYGFHSVSAVVLGTAAADSFLLLARMSGPINWPGLEPLLVLIFVRTGVLASVGYALAYLAAMQRERRRTLLWQNAQLARQSAIVEQLATASERNRLARELHDTFAHTLSALAVELEAARAVWDTDATAARALLDRSLTMTRTGLTEARRALHALRASPLDDLGLPLAIRQVAESVAARAGATLTLRILESGIRFQPEIEQTVYRVAQEALENVARHANAERISVALEQNRASLQLTVSDDGRGFDPSVSDNSPRLGVKGMRERAEMLGGSVEITSRPGGPTAVRLVLPTAI